MTTRISFFVRPLRILSILLCAICLLSAAEAQHGGGGGGRGGGGHSGGGHSGHSSGGHGSRAHSGASHTGGHVSWLHVFRRHPGGKSENARKSSTDLSAGLWNVNTLQSASARRLPSTMIWSPPHFQPGADNRFFGFRPIRHHPVFFFPRFGRFPSSGCFFIGMTQACFFEPFWPLCFGGGFGFYDSGFGFGGTPDIGEESGPTPVDISAMSVAGNPLDDKALGNSSEAQAGSTTAAQDWDLGKGVYVLVLNDGTSRPVTDYWDSDGYLEYVNRDGSRSHIPLETLDLQATMARNAPRGLRFVLRSEPGQEQ